jgi:hypothetical protein
MAAVVAIRSVTGNTGVITVVIIVVGVANTALS